MVICTTHPKVSWEESSFTRGDSRAFATGGGVLRNLLFLSSMQKLDGDCFLPRSHCIFLHDGCITSALNDTPVLAKRPDEAGPSSLARGGKNWSDGLSALVSEATEGAVLLELK